MAKYDLNIGAKVHCQDGSCGKLHKVAVDPHTNRVTDLIIERGFLLTTDRVLPVDVVERASGDDIYLGLSSEDLSDYPEYRVTEFEEPAPEAQAGRYDRNDIRCWMGRYRMACREPVVPMVRRQLHEGVSRKRAVIERGTPVRNKQAAVGEVDHLLIDPESGQVSHLVLQKGLLPYHPILPISKVEAVSDEAVTISLSEDEVEALPRFKSRDAEDIEAELRDRLAQSNLNLDAVEISIEVSVEAGIVHLAGWVPDVEAKRRAEAIARSIEGVIDVENELDTEMAVNARVRHALLADPRTELATIEVRNHRSGVITLTGRVDSPEIAEAAVEIASEQPGVLSVIDELKVEPDENTSLLNARLLSLTMLGQRPR